MKILKSVIMTIALLLSTTLSAQNITSVHGTLSDDMGPLMGATVCEIDATGRIIESALTDLNGNFTMKVRNTKDKIRFSYVGLETVTMPISLVRRAYNTGEVIDLLCFTAQEGVTVSDIVPRVREIIARQHFIDPTDERAIEMINTQLIFGIVDSLFKGINFLIWLIGLGTILAGAIGVSNIMMVSVRERTVEIGIRRAIGATPGMILSQIISESIILTLASGLAGIVFGVGVLSVVELAMTTDGILKAEFQVGFSMALLSAMLLTVLGVLAGLAPSLRAMEIKPVDAMRDE